MTTWENKNMKDGANMFKCAETLGIDTDATQWSHDKLTKYKKDYGKTVPRNAWLGVKGKCWWFLQIRKRVLKIIILPSRN